jgi:hypothetical protein
LRDSKDSLALRQSLEDLSREYAFPGLTHLWGPELYARAPVMFRPFILANFSSVAFEKKWKYRNVDWKGEVGDRLERWLAEVDRAGDAELYRRLYWWKITSQHGRRCDKVWLKDLVARFETAPDSQARRLELTKHDLALWLDQPSAVALYRKDPGAAAPFILKHLPRKYTFTLAEKREWWDDLSKLVKDKGDDDTYFSLYRRQIGIGQWRQDALELCRQEKDPTRLVQELRLRQPDIWNKDLGGVYAELLAARGEELFPYVLPEIHKVLRGWFRDGFDKLITLAEDRGWWELWGALIRACASAKEHERAVQAALKLPPAQGRERLQQLAGVGLEWNLPGFGLARVVPLSDSSACAIYGKFPELLRGPLRSHLVPTASESYDKLAGQLFAHNDEVLLDYLAGRLVTVLQKGKSKLGDAVERFAAHYEALQRDDGRFAQRAASVLGQVPAYAVRMYPELIRNNRLARLMYERSADLYLSDPAALSDLLEAPEIHAQALAYRALGGNSAEARRLAALNLEILLGTLLRPLHRRTRLLAFKALENAAHEPEAAARILARAREAVNLPDAHYPKDQLVGLLGRLLHRYPQFREAREAPTVYRRAECSESA